MFFIVYLFVIVVPSSISKKCRHCLGGCAYLGGLGCDENFTNACG